MKKKSSFGVRMYGILFSFLGSVSLIFALICFFIGYEGHFEEVSAMFGATSILFMILATLFILLGISILLLRFYPLILIILFSSILVGLGLIIREIIFSVRFIVKPSDLECPTFFFPFLIVLLLILGSTLYFFTRPKVKAQFSPPKPTSLD